MPAFKDITGERFGRLLVVIEANKNSSGRVSWLCRCDCGNEAIVASDALVSCRTKSCGCLQRERTADANVHRIKHGHARGAGGNKRATTPEYRSWRAMLERCRNPNAPNYHLYGGRGITFCDEWKEFSAFLADMGPRGDGLTLDRIDTNGHYTKDNCRWADAKTQAKNRRETPELVRSRIDSLNRGRITMWSDPEIRARLLASRRKDKQE